MHRSLSLAVALGLTVQAHTQSPPATFQHTVTYAGVTHVVDFEFHSARGPNFSVLVQQANGSLTPRTPGPVRTYIGTIAALPGAMASALRRADGSTYYHVLFEDGAEWIHNGGATTLRTDADWEPRYPTLVTGSGGAGSTVYAAEIGVDLPYSQFAIDGNADAALEMIEHSVNTVNLLYLRDASLTHRLGRVVIRGSAAQDPYAGMTTTSALFGEVVQQWNHVLPPSTHDIALVATSATGGGLASVGVIGSPGYSANGATTEGDFTIVWRHEAGHNWSMLHFDGDTPEGRSINSGNSLSRMSGAEQAKAIAHRNARLGSLDNLGPHSASIPPRASLDRVEFLPQSPAVSLDVLGNDHDANGDSISIATFDTVTERGGSVTLSPGTGPGGRDELLYAPPVSGQEPLDHFAYRIVDATGREGLGNVITRRTSDSDLLAHYSFDDNVGSLALDSSAYARNATFDGGTSWSAGTVGSAIRLDGFDDRALAAAIDRPTSTFTITGWIRRDGSQNDYAGIVFCRGGSTLAGLNFGTHDELRYHWDGSHWDWDSGLVVPNDTWTFVALTVAPWAATLYMDAGSGLQSAVRFGGHGVEAMDAEISIGRDPSSNSRSFDGWIDDVRIFDRQLSPGEIASLAAGLGSASNPSPGQYALRNASTVTLLWSSSPAAVDHRVYLSQSYAAVRDGAPFADRGLHPGNVWTTPLLGNGTWFWRVDTTDGASWAEGPVWAFTIIPGATLAVAQNYGTGCPGSLGATPAISTIGLPQFGSPTFAIALTNAAASSSATLLLSPLAASWPIGICDLLVDVPVIPSDPLSTDSSGQVDLVLPIPFDVGVLGSRLFGQFVVADPGGALLGLGSMSDGVHLTVGF